jgi:TRAP-type C4-dicarboxylate transport system permease small subunit
VEDTSSHIRVEVLVVFLPTEQMLLPCCRLQAGCLNISSLTLPFGWQPWLGSQPPDSR